AFVEELAMPALGVSKKGMGLCRVETRLGADALPVHGPGSRAKKVGTWSSGAGIFTRTAWWCSKGSGKTRRRNGAEVVRSGSGGDSTTEAEKPAVGSSRDTRSG